MGYQAMYKRMKLLLELLTINYTDDGMACSIYARKYTLY
jgi:hypothetical protein